MKKLLYLFFAFGVFLSCSDEMNTDLSESQSIVKNEYLLPVQIKVNTKEYSYTAAYSYDNQDRITKIKISGKEGDSLILLESDIKYKGDKVANFSLKTKDGDYGTVTPEVSFDITGKFDMELQVLINEEHQELKILNNHLFIDDQYARSYDEKSENMEFAENYLAEYPVKSYFLFTQNPGIFKNSKTPAWVVEFLHEFIAENDKIGFLGALYSHKALGKVYHIDPKGNLADNYTYKWKKYDESGMPHAVNVEWINIPEDSPAKKTILPVSIIYTTKKRSN